MPSDNLRFVRWGGACGLAMILVVLAFGVIGPTLVNGGAPPPESRATETQVRAYFGHAQVGLFALSGPFVALLGILFVAAVRERVRPRGEPFATIALVTFGIFLAGIVLALALSATLVAQTSAGGEVMPLFRLYDVYFNFFLENMQGVAMLVLALAMRHAYPRWLVLGGYVIAALHPVLSLRSFVTGLEVIHMPTMVAFVAWFVAVSVLTMRAPLGASTRADTPDADAA